ncbi:MAG: hypothetical protein AB4050_08945 [Synechococcus sp.]
MRPKFSAIAILGALTPFALASPAEAFPIPNVVQDVYDYLQPILVGGSDDGGGTATPEQQQTISTSIQRSSDPFSNLVEYLFDTNTDVIANYGWSEADVVGSLGIIDPTLLEEGAAEEHLNAFRLLRYQNLASISDSVLGWDGQNRLTQQQAYHASYSAAAYAAAEHNFTKTATAPILPVLQPMFESSVTAAASSHERTATQDVLKDMATQDAWRDSILTSGLGHLGDKLDQIDLALHYYYPRAAQQRAATVNTLQILGNQLLDIQLSNSAHLQLGLRQQQLEQSEHDANTLNRRASTRAALQAAQQVYIPGLFQEERL